MSVTELNNENFKQEVDESKLPVIVDFFANWCNPCNMMKAGFESLSEKYDGKLKFAKLDVDNAQELAGKYGIASIPCLIVFKNGSSIGRIEGYLPEESLKDEIDKVLEKN